MTHDPDIKFSLDQGSFCGATDCPYLRLCDPPHGFQSQGGSLTCILTCLHAVHCSCLICTFSYHWLMVLSAVQFQLAFSFSLLALIIMSAPLLQSWVWVYWTLFTCTLEGAFNCQQQLPLKYWHWQLCQMHYYIALAPTTISDILFQLIIAKLLGKKFVLVALLEFTHASCWIWWGTVASMG